MAANTFIGVPMTIQLLNKQGNNYRLNIYGCECVFKPMELFTTGLFPVKKCIVNGSLGWYVNRRFVSYRKIKKVLTHRQVKPDKIEDMKEHRATPHDGKKVMVIDKKHPHYGATAICMGADLTTAGWAMKFKNVNSEEEFYVFHGKSVQLIINQPGPL